MTLPSSIQEIHRLHFTELALTEKLAEAQSQARERLAIHTSPARNPTNDSPSKNESAVRKCSEDALQVIAIQQNCVWVLISTLACRHARI